MKALLFFITLLYSITNSIKRIQPIWRNIINETGNNNSTSSMLGICYGDSTNWIDYPFVVSIRYQSGDACCTGSILNLNPAKILTAAHCNVCRGLVKIGCNNPSNCDTNQYQSYRIASFIIHDNYNENTFENDIAIITLNRPITNPTNVKTVQLAKSVTESEQKWRIIGYGEIENRDSPSTLQTGIEKHISQSHCKRIMSNLGLDDVIYESMICMEGMTNDNDFWHPYHKVTMCSGDSGGPIMDNTNNIQYGINSWVLIGDNGPCNANCYCCTKYPQVGISIAYYYDWIQLNMRLK